MSRIVLDGVSKHFGPVVAVEDFNLAIEDGEFLVLLGPSGCGPSTALRTIVSNAPSPPRYTLTRPVRSAVPNAPTARSSKSSPINS